MVIINFSCLVFEDSILINEFLIVLTYNVFCEDIFKESLEVTEVFVKRRSNTVYMMVDRMIGAVQEHDGQKISFPVLRDISFCYQFR